MPDEHYNKTLLLLSGAPYNNRTAERPISYGAWVLSEFDINYSVLSSTYSKDYTSSFSTGTVSSTNRYISYTNSFPFNKLFPIDTATIPTFTLEAWVYQLSSGTSPTLYPLFRFGSTTNKINVYFDRTVTDPVLMMDIHTGNSTTPASTLTGGSVTRATWNHIVLQVDGSLASDHVQLFINGVYQGALDYPTFGAAVDDFAIGAGNIRTTTLTYGVFYMQDCRYTWNTARYSTSGFTAPGQFMKTISGIVYDSAGDPFNGEICAIPRKPLDPTMYAFFNPFVAESQNSANFFGPRTFYTTANASGEFSFTVPDVEMTLIYFSKDGEANLLNDLVSRVYPG